MMGMNMNLTYPIADWLFGTSDLDRGLIGHIFNGYDARFVKRNLKKPRATAADSRSIYGPLAAPIAVLLWLYLVAIAVLIGAAVNASFDKIFVGER